ncbi:MAG: NosD domain-containing protein [Candidatus Binatia bacterium]
MSVHPAAGVFVGPVLGLAVLVMGLPARATVVVQPGGSIQAAIDAAPPGEKILVRPGVYREGMPGDVVALTITKDNIKLIAKSTRTNPVILENAGSQGFGIWVSPADSVPTSLPVDAEMPACATTATSVKGFQLRGFTLRGFDVHGVHLACVNKFKIIKNIADGNQVYGIFPVQSQNGQVLNNEALNTPLDAAIYIGQSDNIRIQGNSVHDSLIGIEVENSRDCMVKRNLAFTNTVGILVDLLPGLLKATEERIQVDSNVIAANNRANTGTPGDITSFIPAGTGILLLAPDTTTVQKNVVSENDFAGIAVASFCTALAIMSPGEPCANLGIDPNPDGDQIIKNTLRNNGTAPDPSSPVAALAADLVWDTLGTDNCWGDNVFSTTFPDTGLPACP